MTDTLEQEIWWKGNGVRALVGLLLVTLVLAGCGGPSAAAPTVTPSPPATATSPPATPSPTPVTFNHTYLSFVHTICHALATRNAGTISNNLAHYQYNSGVRYGQLGDGEGQTGDPSILTTWLSHPVRCVDLTPSLAGHGSALTSGWPQPGGWGIIEFDTFNGQWRINDFTFGTRHDLYRALANVQRPVVSYRAA